jgi:uncharacterized protein (DUF486 family)
MLEQAPWSYLPHLNLNLNLNPPPLRPLHQNPIPMRTVLLLFCSNIFMTFAWYGHLKYGHAWPMWKAIVVSWLIAFIEYCFAVPANRLGFGEFTGFQLKIIQEGVTLTVFMIFAITFLKEKMAWNYLVAFLLIALAAYFAFAFKPGSPA